MYFLVDLYIDLDNGVINLLHYSEFFVGGQIMDLKNSTYLAEWKEKMTEVIRLQYNKDQIGDKRVEEYLDQVVAIGSRR